MRVVGLLVARVGSLLVTLLALGLSLLPLSALLIALPAVAPQESVLADNVHAPRSRLRGFLRRLAAVAAGVTVLVALTAVSVEVVTQLPLPKQGAFASIARAFMPAPITFMGRTPADQQAVLDNAHPVLRDLIKTPLFEKLPPAMVQHWPFVVLVVYLADLLILLNIGKVPLRYNLRNVRVRWLTNLMTGVVFTFVIGLLVSLLAFVNGMNRLTQNTGIPGNVFALSDGATDELFSSLGHGDLDNVERVVVELDQGGSPLKTPVRVKQVERDGRSVYLASRETYYAINQAIPHTDPARRRFVQLRTLEDPWVGQQVHDITLYPGGSLPPAAGVDDRGRIQCVLGEGAAATLGIDQGKPRLDCGDTFSLGEMEWVVTGVMRAEGTTFGSEIWARRFSRIYRPFGREKHTTLVLRTDAGTAAASKAMAYHLSKRYPQQKLMAFSEPDYYADLTKTNNDFLAAIVVVAVVMAVGGVFGMMTTMFASLAQRIRDIGVLRLLGFKRWQVMVSFLLESLAVALAGGATGCFLVWLLVDGRGSTSTLAHGGGGPGVKSVVLTIDVDAEVTALGLLFTLVMGRLGGLVPALSAMRMKILDTLR